MRLAAPMTSGHLDLSTHLGVKRVGVGRLIDAQALVAGAQPLADEGEHDVAALLPSPRLIQVLGEHHPKPTAQVMANLLSAGVGTLVIQATRSLTGSRRSRA